MIARSQKNLRLKKTKKRKKAAMTSFVSYASFFVESKKKVRPFGKRTFEACQQRH
jgi:hypothetical protein